MASPTLLLFQAYLYFFNHSFIFSFAPSLERRSPGVGFHAFVINTLYPTKGSMGFSNSNIPYTSVLIIISYVIQKIKYTCNFGLNEN